MEICNITTTLAFSSAASSKFVSPGRSMPRRSASWGRPHEFVQGLDRRSRVLGIDGGRKHYSWGRLGSGRLAQGPEAPEQLKEPTFVAPESVDRRRVVAGAGRRLAVNAE